MRSAFWVALAVVTLPAVASAQQNLFNVPSGEVTPAYKLFYQQQTNFTGGSIQPNTTLDFGLGHGLEVGLNVFNVPLYAPNLGENPDPRGIQQPDVLFNALKSFTISERFRVAVGTQFGETAPVFQSRVRPDNFTYTVAAFDLPQERGTLYGGAYYSNRNYRGTGVPLGVMVGCDIPIVEKKLHFMADLIGGNNDLSLAVVGVVVYLPHNWQLSLGAQFPSPGSNNPYGGVLELTYVPGKD